MVYTLGRSCPVGPFLRHQAGDILGSGFHQKTKSADELGARNSDVRTPRLV